MDDRELHQHFIEIKIELQRIIKILDETEETEEDLITYQEENEEQNEEQNDETKNNQKPSPFTIKNKKRLDL